MEKIIYEALSRYGLQECPRKLIRHNENITCKVDSSDRSYVLRIRKPVTGFNTTIFGNEYSAEMLVRGELELLEHMNRNGFNGLQQPVKDINGLLASTLSDGSVVSLLTWIEGTEITPEQGAILAREIGVMAVRIHKASEGFCGPCLRYDVNLINSMKNEIAHASAEDHIGKEEASVCIDALTVIGGIMNELEKKGRACGLIHADLGCGNIISTPGGLIPIDFSLSGYGCYAQECGMIQSNWTDDAVCEKVLLGFRDGGEEIDPRHAEAFLALSVLLFISAQHSRFYADEWFSAAMRRWTETLFRPLITG